MTTRRTRVEFTFIRKRFEKKVIFKLQASRWNGQKSRYERWKMKVAVSVSRKYEKVFIFHIGEKKPRNSYVICPLNFSYFIFTKWQNAFFFSYFIFTKSQNAFFFIFHIYLFFLIFFFSYFSFIFWSFFSDISYFSFLLFYIIQYY